MKIIKLTSNNIKRLSAVEIDPDGSLVIIGGKNGAGKSSVLDSIVYALGGGSTHPSEPVHRGKRRASVLLDLGELTVERTFSTNGAPQLTVRNAEGVEQKRPQSILDALCSSISFNPLEYSRMGKAKQAEVLRKLSGVDTSTLDEQRDGLYGDRTAKNRKVKDLKSQLKSMPIHKDAPSKEVSVADLMAELERRQGVIADNRVVCDEAVEAKEKRTAISSQLSDVEREVTGLEERLKMMREQRDALKVDLRNAKKEVKLADAKAIALIDPSLEEVREQLKSVEETNSKVRANAERAKLSVDLQAVVGEVDVLSDGIAELDDMKEKLLAEAEMPLEGLGFDEDGVTLQGVPLEQASQAEQLRLSVAIGFALNPKLRVCLVRDGSLLDSDSMRLVAGLAEQHDGQLWIERVGDGDEGAIIIEDGSVRADTEEQSDG